jgi:hypothetical protein
MFLFIFICFSFTFPSPQDPSLEVTTLSSWPFAQKEHALCYGTTWPPDSRLRSPQHQWHNWCRTVTVATGGADVVSGPSLVVVCFFCLETATRFSQKQPFSHQYWALENIDNIASKIHISMAWVPSAKKYNILKVFPGSVLWCGASGVSRTHRTTSLGDNCRRRGRPERIHRYKKCYFCTIFHIIIHLYIILFTIHYNTHIFLLNFFGYNLAALWHIAFLPVQSQVLLLRVHLRNLFLGEWS